MTADDLRARFGSLGAEDVAALDHAAVAGGVLVLQLMEIAGFQVARCAWEYLGLQPGRVVAVAGRGNNGGDALVAARHLVTWGCTVDALLLWQDEPEVGPALAQARAAQGSGVVCARTLDPNVIAETCAAADLVIDGILGTGLRSAPREPLASVIRSVNAAGTAVLSVDIPSGMDAGTGEAFDPCVRAARTCTLAAVKAGLWAPQSAAIAGDLWAADIGMPRYAWHAVGLHLPTALRGGALLPVPSATSH
jgi:NAD(P)H-hydrate epimerase